MAAILLIAFTIAATRAQQHISSIRSPLLLLPPHSPPLSEQDLKRAFRSWTARERALSGRFSALSAAVAKGDKRCWAGVVERLGEVRRARDEARWVVDKLGEAVRWVEEQGVRKGRWRHVVGKRAGINRPKHQATPPSLWEIELPLPIALRVDETTLTVKRAPIEPPPAYRPEVDLGAGERVVERRGMMFA